MDEPVYCAELINIPPELPEILKVYSKEVIRAQPQDIFDFSARYFGRLAAMAQGETPSNIKVDVETIKDLFKLSVDRNRKLKLSELAPLADAVGIPRLITGRILKLAELNKNLAITIYEFTILVLTVTAANAMSAIETAFLVFSGEGEEGGQGLLKASLLLKFLKFLHHYDHNITINVLNEAELLAKSEGDDHDPLLSFGDFAASPAADLLRM